MNQNDLKEHWITYIYDQKLTQEDEDVQHVLSIVGTSPLNILEVACGSGRISIPLAQTGHFVTGFDIDESMLERIPEKAAGLTNFNYYKADAISDDWGTGFDVVVLSGNLLNNIVTNGGFQEAQELFIKKAASCVKKGGHMYLDFDCIGGEDSPSPDKGDEVIIFEGTDDLGTYGKYILVGGEYNSKTRIDRSYRRWEITPKDGEMFKSVNNEVIKHFSNYDEVTSWLEKYGWEIEWQAPVSEETFYAIIWAKKK
ncbi:MAG: class I SAM-dependent methyltransferase [Oscillospiraceae bacterium]|nr:class I SAM-dependent methyltransferase [Oscillospiraceae bacterium]